jgi:hypothetical protein
LLPIEVVGRDFWAYARLAEVQNLATNSEIGFCTYFIREPIQTACKYPDVR